MQVNALLNIEQIQSKFIASYQYCAQYLWSIFSKLFREINTINWYYLSYFYEILY